MTQPDAVALHVSRRLFALEGETRINLLRVFAVAAFYLVHLVNRYLVGMTTGATLDTPLGTVPVYDTAATAISIAWAAMSAAVLLIVRSSLLRRIVAPGTTALDVAFLALLLLIGNGPSSPMVVVLPLLIAASGMRGQREMVWLATVGGLIAYALSIGAALQFRPDLMPPRYHILVVSMAVVMAGVVTDVTVSGFWRLVEQHTATLARVTAAASSGSADGAAEMAVPAASTHCPWCGDGVSMGATRCARCEQPLKPGVAFTTGRGSSLLQAGKVHLGWTATVIGLAVLAIALGIGIGIELPALVVPYIGATLLVLLALGRMIQLDLRVDENDRALGRTASTLGTAAATVALGATALTMLLGMILLLMVATFVVAFALCCMAVGGAYGIH
ncbi:MAG: hypothetical protein R3F61_34235 [Myxococcota bacterium]